MKRRELGPVPSLATGSPGAWIVAAADARRFLHDHEATALQMPHDPIGRYPRRECLGIMHALSAAKAEGECDALGEIAGLGRLELVIGHGRTIAARLERSKNIIGGSRLTIATLGRVPGRYLTAVKLTLKSAPIFLNPAFFSAVLNAVAKAGLFE